MNQDHSLDHELSGSPENGSEPIASNGAASSRRWRGPFCCVPTAAVFDPRLTDAQLRTLAALASFADPHGCCFPSHGRIARKLDIWRQTVQRHLRKAAGLGYIRATRQIKPNGGYSSNIYQLLYPPVPITQNGPPEEELPGGGGMGSREIEKFATSQIDENERDAI